MELFLGSFVIILLGCAGLMVGQFFGRAPISGSCSSNGHCAQAGSCKLECAFRRGPRHGRGHEHKGGAS
jgi:hypothetical protein